ncbi:hypothetical protein GCM10010515_37750 [Streptomyces fructofermentans]|uniref:Uncharacterized protein n=1 Tax=Streptomyces fructofermentans TaxID=152141 RepID=A0A918KMD9_9ACTN|nr:hypothetical protein GCM10010515_37750 [Streptomyces fructofermentans]
MYDISTACWWCTAMSRAKPASAESAAGGLVPESPPSATAYVIVPAVTSTAAAAPAIHPAFFDFLTA